MKRLSNDQILTMAPSAGAIFPLAAVSDRYSFLPTIEVVDMLRKEGWFPTVAQEVRTRKQERAGFQKHLIRLQHDNLVLGDEATECILINSHDRSCAYQLSIGVYRFVCSNGMMVGETFEKVSVRHMGFNPDDIIDASYEVIENAPLIAENVNSYKGIHLGEGERLAYAASCLPLLYEDPEEAPIRPARLLYARHSADTGNDLWSTLNVVQENVMKGGLRAYDRRKRRITTTRAVKSIDRSVKLNKALWTLTEKMAELKAA